MGNGYWVMCSFSEVHVEYVGPNIHGVGVIKMGLNDFCEKGFLSVHPTTQPRRRRV